MRLKSRRILDFKRLFASYVQGQSPAPKTREYFYYIDHQGQLFMDDAKVKNFITCFKDKKFLAFFFKRLKRNTTNRYMDDFPYISPCGPETNYVRCDDRPIVFTQLLNQDKQVIQNVSEYGRQVSIHSEAEPAAENCWLSYNGTGDHLLYPFQPQKLYMAVDSGRVYHQGLPKLGGVGLVKSSLAIELSGFFTYSNDKLNRSPVGFLWKGHCYELDSSNNGISTDTPAY